MESEPRAWAGLRVDTILIDWMQVQSSAACWLMAACLGIFQVKVAFDDGMKRAPSLVVASQ